jgi:hypothetical protein
MCTAASEVAGRAHGSGLDLGVREQATAEQDGKLVRLDRIVFGCAAVNGFYIEGMPQDKGNALLGTEVDEPISGKHPLDGHDEPLAVRGNGLEKGFRSGFHVAVQQDCSIVIHDADVHAPSV